MSFTSRIRHFGSKLRQSVEPVSEKQSYLFEALVVILLLLLLVLGIIWL